MCNRVYEARCKEALKGMMDVIYELTGDKDILAKSERLGVYILTQIKQGMVNG